MIEAAKHISKKIRDSYRQILVFFACFIITFLISLSIYHTINPNANNSVPVSLGFAFSALMISVSAAVAVSIIEKLGVTIGTEGIVISKIDEVKTDIRELINMKLEHGLTGVIKDKSLEVTRFQDLIDGDEIEWINTVIRDFSEISRSVREAVLTKEVKIRILLMPGDCHGASFRWRMLDPELKEDSFINVLHMQEKQFSELIEDLEKESCKGSLEVRFYKFFIGFPLFIFERNSTRHEEAYTGFFINKASRRTPYVRWESSSESPYFLDLKAYFDHLWEDETVVGPRSSQEISQIISEHTSSTD